jgi:hypothetical protein
MKIQMFCFVAGALLLSCRPPSPDHVPELTIVDPIDLREYTLQGFLFTPGTYSGDFEAIGIIRLTTYPEENLVEVERERRDGSMTKNTFWQPDLLDYDSMLDAMKRQCEKMGANALTHLEFKFSVPGPIEFPKSKNPLHRFGVEISGFAVKRLGAFGE